MPTGICVCVCVGGGGGGGGQILFTPAPLAPANCHLPTLCVFPPRS